MYDILYPLSGKTTLGTTLPPPYVCESYVDSTIMLIAPMSMDYCISYHKYSPPRTLTPCHYKYLQYLLPISTNIMLLYTINSNKIF